MSQPRYLPGQRLGPYEILALVGEGGMGQVYRGRDTRIDRIVAIKVLTGELSEHPGRRERFEREARVIGGLNHPHIGMLFDVGEHDGSQFLVMEFLEGETLARRIGRGALPMEEVLHHAVEIAGGLSEAHRRGVIHRDLKPGNVMLTKSGAKIVDFGVAKLRPQESLVELSAAPTREKDLTGAGVMVGTIQYMAPEQLEGKEVDARTDLFAFGEILYEMATGKRAFEGTSQASLVAAILRGEPAPISAVRPMTPRAIDRVVRKCLRKEPDERWQTAADLKDVLQWLAEEGPEPKPGSTKGPRFPRVVAASIAVASVIGILVWTLGRDVSQPFPITRTEIPLPFGEVFPYDVPFVTISADGRRIAYVGQSGNDRRIFVREIDRMEARPVAGTEGGAGPFFSPDGEWLGFFADGELKKVSLRGGAAVTLYQGASDARGGTWGPDDRIVCVPDNVSGLLRVAASGETPEVLTTPNREDREKNHRHPEILPDGQAVLFTMASADISSFDDARIEVLSLETGKRHILIEGGMNPRYAASGHLLFARAGSLFAAPFDPRRLAITGPVTPVVQGVMTSPEYGHAGFAVSSEGTLVYAPGDGQPPRRKLIWVYRDGRVQEISSEAERRPFLNPRLSPDGRTLAVAVDAANNEVWLLDLARGALTRSAWGWDNNLPIWTRDGERLTINSNRGGQWNLFGYPADGSGSVERLTTDDNAQAPGSWSPDGKTLAFTQLKNETSREDIWLLPRGGNPEPFLATSSREGGPEFSPNGRFLAYASDESGRREVYVRPVSGPGAVQQVSTSGGHQPAWSGDGRELFYREGVRTMSVTIQTEPAFALSKPQQLFERAALGDDYPEIGFRFYDVSPDGQRFVMVEPESRPPISRFHVVTNWFEELRRLAPEN